MSSIKEIGDLVRQSRKQAKITQIEAAALSGVGTRFLSELENGKVTLHIGKVMQVLKNLGFVVIIKKRQLNER